MPSPRRLDDGRARCANCLDGRRLEGGVRRERVAVRQPGDDRRIDDGRRDESRCVGGRADDGRCRSGRLGGGLLADTGLLRRRLLRRRLLLRCGLLRCGLQHDGLLHGRRLHRGLLHGRRGCVDGRRHDVRRRRRSSRRLLDGRRRCGRRVGRSRSRSGRRIGCRSRRRRGRQGRREHGQEAERVEIPLRIGARPHAEVDVGPVHLRRAARADGADRSTLRHGRVARDGDRAEVRQRDRQPVGRLDRHRLAARRYGPREADDAGRRRDDGRVRGRRDVDAAVLPARVGMRRVEREALDDGARDGPRPGARRRRPDQEHEHEYRVA
jgi:hypothetical protein